MTFYRGRLIDHVHLRATDFSKTRKFYEAIAAVLGVKIEPAGETYMGIDELWIDASDSQTIPTHVHLAFQADDEAQVKAFYAAALKAGGTGNGAPGERRYHPGYYAAFVLDPDGNNIEAVFHGPSRRSADSVEIEIGA